MIINIFPWKVLSLLFVIALFLVIISIIVNVLNLGGFCESEIGLMVYKNFNVDNERNVPTYFSSSIMLASSIMMLLCYSLNFKKRGNNYGWIILSVVMLILSFDEITEVHEYFAGVIHNLGIGTMGRLSYTVWTIPYLIFIGIFLIFIWNFLINLPNYLRVGYILSGVIFVTGAIGFEVLSHYFANIKGIYILLSSIEEFLEMLGFILFIYYTLKYLQKEFNNITFKFEESKEIAHV